MLHMDPCVYAVGSEYVIVFNAAEPGIAWAECMGNTYRDSENGLMGSETTVHRVTIPMDALDTAKAYTVCFRPLPERKPYYPEPGPVEKRAYAFRPVPARGPVRALMLADTHSMIREPLAAASAAGAFDLLLLNGDIPAESRRREDILGIFGLAGALCGGSIPVVFARGNHDLRGRLATELPRYVGTRDRETFFTFRLGGIWGIVLDCGEDKPDTDPEYGGMVDCHTMRLRETAWLKAVAARAREEYAAPGVTTRIALCHIPFCTQAMADEGARFDIERDIYREWTECLNRMGPDAMFCGHTHALELVRPGSARARYGMGFPVVIGSKPVLPGGGDPGRNASFTGICMEMDGSRIRVDTVSDAGERREMARLGG